MTTTTRTTLWFSRSLATRSSRNLLASSSARGIKPHCRACFLSSTPASAVAAPTGSEDDEPVSQQAFVQARLRPGEWDPDHRQNNPLYRPAFKSRAKIVSAQDFANRPRVGFSGEFESLSDAMVTLSWLQSADQERIYQWYLNLMQYSQKKHGVSSHEYVVRVIAQKFNITPERVGATIQLQHNEEQMKQDPNVRLLTEAADYMDQAIENEIQMAYKTFHLRKPTEEPFVEDPVGVSEMQESKSWQTVEDLFDVDQLTSNAATRDQARARLVLDGHVYIEDKDDAAQEIPLNKECRKLLVKHEKWAAEKKTPSPDGPATQADGTKRPRWKFVAQAMNTRQLKKEKRPHSSYVNNHAADTLVEENGTLRAATMADVKQTAWKPVRHVQEHIYSGAKKAWLDRTVRGESGRWGMAAPQAKAPAVVEAAPVEEDETTAAGDASSSSDEEAKAPAVAEAGLAEKDETAAAGDASSSSDEEIDGNVISSSSDDSSESESESEDEKEKRDDSDDDSKKD